jgi:hypothetical protein
MLPLQAYVVSIVSSGTAVTSVPFALVLVVIESQTGSLLMQAPLMLPAFLLLLTPLLLLVHRQLLLQRINIHRA